MNPKQLILALPKVKRHMEADVPKDEFLNIAEFFCDTIQGENFVGYPAAFLRMQGCTQNCIFCDTQEVWRFGNPYTFDELFEMMEYKEFNLIRKFREGQHLVLTGGSPVLQQDSLIQFLKQFRERYSFLPYIEIENECTIIPKWDLVQLVDCWNNSPKLANSLNPKSFRYQPDILKFLSSLDNAWFKFVISNEYEEDWKEIQTDFIDTGLIRKDQIVLMPMGATRVELFVNREAVINLAIEQNVRYSTREHIVIWDKKTGI